MQRRTFLSSALTGAGLSSALLGTGAALLSPKAEAAPSAAAGPLTAQTTEGPYYLALDLVRADITEGLHGIPLDVAFTVLDADGRPSTGAIVDIWHCDAEGRYSGFDQPGGKASKGTTFLRGSQVVGQDGRVVFHSLYPGWYQGRTTHIHFKVRRGQLTNLTSQFFLPDTLSEYLYTQVAAYKREAVRDTLNSTDGIAIEAGATVHGGVREDQGRYVAALTVYVDPAANPPIDRPPAPGQMPLGQMPPGMKDMPPPGGFSGPPPFQTALSGDQRLSALLPTAKPSAARPPMPPRNG